MARIVVSTDQGEVVEIIGPEDIGDLNKPLARAHIAEEVASAVLRAEGLDALNEGS